MPRYVSAETLRDVGCLTVLTLPVVFLWWVILCMSGSNDRYLWHFSPWFYDCLSVLVHTLVLYQIGGLLSGSFYSWGSGGR